MSRPGRLLVRLAAAGALAATVWLISIPAQAPEVRGAVTLPSGFTDTEIAGGIASPTAMALAPDGRIFVAEQGGALRVIKNGSLLAAPFLTVPVDAGGERGLLGVAFHPNFASNQYVYVYYTATSPTVHNRLSRFTASGDVAVPGSETVILDLNPLSGSTNHNGGAIHFGADGKLYVAVGENDNGANAQTLTNLLGKMLRINADGTIPTDNPFYNTASGVNRAIWALGLRNPFSFAVQPGTGRMFINDVGADLWEEINDGIAGSNYGWPATEGYTSNPSYRSPLYAYPHSGGTVTGCAITGGAFYNPTTVQFPGDYVGDYFFADFCNGWIKRFDPTTSSVTGFAEGISSPVDLHIATDGSLYYLARGPGAVHRVKASQAPSITSNPSNLTVSAGSPATFTVTASGTPPLSYQWQRDGINIPGATSASYTLPSATLSDSGTTFRVRVSNAYGITTSTTAILTVVAGGAPTGTITAPPAGTTYAAGDLISYSGTGTDPEDGTLPASAFTWRVDFHHESHVHPFIPATSGSRSGSFTVPTDGEASANVWYRIHLTVRDSSGLTNSSFRDILPRTSTLRLRTSPPGLQVTLDGQPITTPADVASVEGMTRTLGVVSPQTAGATTYVFNSWSDAGAATHAISTPASDTTYTASFTASQVVTFDDRPGQNEVLSGEYPTGVIDWGTGSWWHSEPWGAMTTKSVTFNGAGVSQATFTLLTPERLVSLLAYNGGSATTVTLSCPGQPNKIVSLGSGQLTTITTGWSGTCASVTIESTNGWNTNFDNLVLGSQAPPNADSDEDGCADGRELQTAAGTEAFGGRRNPNYFWDFFDVPTGATLVRDRIVSSADIATVITRFGSTDAGPGTFNRNSDPLSTPNPVSASMRERYHPAYDRGGGIPGGHPWDLLPPDGSISGGDIAGSVAQFGHSCV